MNKEALIKILQDNFSYPKSGARIVAEKIMDFQPELFSSFITFIEKGVVPNISIEGYDFDSLNTQFGMTPIAGFLTLDWLMREPVKAKKSLQKGYDSVQKK